MRTPFIIILISLISFSCVKVAKNQDFEPKFVVEGVIEDGGYPLVKVTHNIPKDYVLNKKQLENLIIRWATVRVFNDYEEEILTLSRDDEVFPYLFYIGKSLKGKAGEKYHLEVTYNDIVLRSETDIPIYKPVIDSVGYRWVDDNKAQPLVGIFNSNPDAHYRLYTKLDSQHSYYTTSPKGFKAIDQPKGSHSLYLLRERVLLDTVSGRSKYYAKGDEVVIKASNVSESSYALWSAYTQQGLQFSFLNYSENFRGNIKGAGIGIWYGANSSVKKLSIK